MISAQTDPTRFVLIVTGDFNFLSPGDFRRSNANPNVTKASLHPATNPGQLMNVLQPILDKLIDMAVDLDTRYDSASRLCSRLDRVYISVPSWTVTQLHFQSFVVSDPHSLHDLKISDHAPSILSISAKERLKQEELPIPRFVFDMPLYSETLVELVRAANLDALSVPVRLPKFNQLIREAARIARNETLTKGADKAQANRTIFSSIARCVWRNDTRLFDVLVRRSSLAASFLIMDGSRLEARGPRLLCARGSCVPDLVSEDGLSCTTWFER